MMDRWSKRRFSIAGRGRPELDENRIFEIADRALNLLELWITRKYPVVEEAHGEVWKKGDPLPEPQSIEEYRDFPRDQPGRFSTAIAAARANRDT